MILVLWFRLTGKIKDDLNIYVYVDMFLVYITHFWFFQIGYSTAILGHRYKITSVEQFLWKKDVGKVKLCGTKIFRRPVNFVLYSEVNTFE
jgi:hypothetical protein